MWLQRLKQWLQKSSIGGGSEALHQMPQVHGAHGVHGLRAAPVVPTPVLSPAPPIPEEVTPPPKPLGNFTYKGFEIPIELMHKTGGGPDKFDLSSKSHMSNLEQSVGIRPNDSVLEIGCGIGRDAIPLTERLSAAGSYVGIDIDLPSIEWCRSAITPKHPNFRFEHFDVKDGLYNPHGKISTPEIVLPVADGSVDLIILQSVFTHLFADDILHFLREFRRVLKENGRVYATLFLYNDAVLESTRNNANLTAFNLRFLHPHSEGCLQNSLEIPTAAIAYTEEAFDALIAASGLRRVAPYLRGSWSGYYEDATDGQDRALLGRSA